MPRSRRGFSSWPAASEPPDRDREKPLAKVEWSDGATRRVEEIYDDIAIDRPLAAAGFVAALVRLGDSLETFPRRGRSLGGETRELTSVKPYVIRYVYDPERDVVEILTVWHGARDMGR